MKKIKPNEIPKKSIIIDVLSDASFEVEHIRGAQNFCIYEVDFGDKITKSFRNKKPPLYLYGLSNRTNEAKRAAFVLEQLGYQNVFIIDGGLEQWKKQKLSTIKGKTGSALDGKYILSTKESRVEWTGRNIGNKHTGIVKIKDGFVRIKRGDLVGGELTIAMKTITDSDLEGKWKKMLENHLKSSDFFEVAKFPTAELSLLEAKLIDNVASKPNYDVKAKLKIKDVEKKIRFKAQIHEKDGMLAINAHLDLDRSKWGVAYGSEKFFARLGKHLIDDVVSFDLIVFGKRM